MYQVITDRIIALLEQGVVPWRKPWVGSSAVPRNLVSKRPYQGINIFMLLSAEYSSVYWVTFNQARQLGGNVRKGERASPVVFWRWVEVEDKGSSGTQSSEKRKLGLARYYSVFNVLQCEGLGQHVPEESAARRIVDPIPAAESIVRGMPQCPQIQHGFRAASYSPKKDLVKMPERDRFCSAEEYYSTLFHELAHSTGHANRLNRSTLMQRSEDREEGYSKEELVAEMCSTFLCSECGILTRTLQNSAAYIEGWLESLRSDKTLVVHAAVQAQRAAEFILGRSESCEPRGESVDVTAQGEVLAAAEPVTT